MKKSMLVLAALTAGCFFVASVGAIAADAAPAPAKTDAKAAPAKTDAKAAPAKGGHVSTTPAPKADPKNAKKSAPGDSPVAVVNGKPIKKRDFDLSVKAYLRDVSRQMGGKHDASTMTATDEIKADILERMVKQEVLFQEIEKQKLTGVDELAQKEFEASKAQFPSEDEFKNALKEEGLDDKSLMDMIRRKVSLKMYVDSVVIPGIKVPDDEAKKFYDDNPKYFEAPENVKACHILVSVPATATEDQKKASREKIEAIRKKLLEGADFATLAKESSDCPSSIQGGDLGSFPRGRMVKPFEDAAFSQKTGEIGEVVETQFGYHVIRVDEHKQADKVSFDVSKERIVNYLKNQKVQKVLEEKTTELRKGAKVDVVSSHL